MINLLHGDCLEIMPDIESGSVDLILADPPYGMTACKWDSVIPLEPMWALLKRIIKPNGAIVMTASQPFTSVLIMSNIKAFRHEWIWKKNRGSNFAVLKYHPMKEHESVVVFGYNKINYYPIKEDRNFAGLARTKYGYRPSNTGRRETMGGWNMKHARHDGQNPMRFPSSVKKFNCEVGLHPTQKPVSLMKYMIKTYSNQDDLVLDFCMGSGSTGVAANNLNREFIGIEKEEKYFKIAEKRISNQAPMQMEIAL